MQNEFALVYRLIYSTGGQVVTPSHIWATADAGQVAIAIDAQCGQPASELACNAGAEAGSARARRYSAGSLRPRTESRWGSARRTEGSARTSAWPMRGARESFDGSSTASKKCSNANYWLS